MTKFLKNPLAIWVRWLLLKLFLESKNKGNKLTIEYLAFLKKCKVGYCNRIYDYSILTSVDLGDFTYVSDNCRINNTKIGKFCSIGPYVKCGIGKHPTRDFVSTHPVFFSNKRQCGVSFVDEVKFVENVTVNIGNDVWVGANAVIMDGVIIGDGVIVAAGAIVTEDVPPYAIVGGVPAKLIRYRFTEEVINRLLVLKWWDKDITWIKHRAGLFCNVHNFLEKAHD